MNRIFVAIAAVSSTLALMAAGSRETSCGAQGRNMGSAATNNRSNTTYRVDKGDSLWSIARKFGCTVEELKDVNACVEVLHAGRTLTIPSDRAGRTFDEWRTENIDVVDAILLNDAELAAKKCEYPLRLNLEPLIQPIKNEQEFIEMFPVIFDKKERQRIFYGLVNEKGWNYHNYQEEMFACGGLWRDYYTKKLSVVNDVSRHLFEHLQKLYAKDLLTLAPKYRSGCTWPAYYFVSEDDAYFGRVDSLGNPWAKTIPGTAKVSERFRIMLFKAGQRASDDPYRVFVYDEKDDLEFGNRSADEIVAKKEGFEFGDLRNRIRHGEAPEMFLEYDMNGEHPMGLRLKNVNHWPPFK